MDKELNDMIRAQIERCENMLINKNAEYASDQDRLHNFHVAAELMGTTPKQALSGFMAKHIVSVYDMCGSEKAFTTEQWNEKITDSINYLLLLSALVAEEKENETCCGSAEPEEPIRSCFNCMESLGGVYGSACIECEKNSNWRARGYGLCDTCRYSSGGPRCGPCVDYSLWRAKE